MPCLPPKWQQKFISFEHQFNELFKCHPSIRANTVLPLQLIVIQELPYYVAENILTSNINFMSSMYPKTSWKSSPRSPNRVENRICHLGQSQPEITCGGHVRHVRGVHFVSRRSRFSFSIIAATSTLGNSEKFTSCGHPPLDPEKIDRTQWLTPGSTSHQALQSIVLKKTLIKTLDQMTEATHTGALDVYHSLIFKYCEKQNHFFKILLSILLTISCVIS